MMTLAVSFLAGIGAGWILCHYTTVRHLIWTVRDMRKLGYVYDHSPEPREPAESIEVNET